MNEKRNAAGLNNGTNPRGCGRTEELVTYLYGEAAPEEAKTFRLHLNACAVCREEFAAFGGVRETVGEWRAEALSTVPSLNIGETFAPAETSKHASVERSANARKRSATAALREFFSLSPLWLQVGTVAAALVVCALAALVFARAEVRWGTDGFAFRTGVSERVIKEQAPVNVPNGYTQAQVDALIKEGVDRELTTERARWEAENKQRAIVLQAGLDRQKSTSRGGNPATPAGRQQGTRQTAPGNNTREQLAKENPNEDYFYPNEERVPRLTDLLGVVKSPNKTNER